MNIGLALDKSNNVESKVVGINEDILIKQKKDLELGHRKILDSYNAGAENRNNGFKNISAEIKEPVSKDGIKWKGWGTCLKPSFEPIIVARKPFKGSLVDNVIKYGVGGINIDECRVGTEERTQFSGRSQSKSTVYNSYNQNNAHYETVQGRFPANTILTYDESDFDEVCGGFPYTKSTGGSASRYFYCAKASRKDRDEGLEDFEEKLPACVTDFRPTLATNPENWNNGNPVDNPMMRTTPRKNTHPTVKPTELMQYLVRLVTPKGGTILDPFMGSGSTGKAVMYENKERNANYKFIGIEREKEYCDISEARIKYASKFEEGQKEKDNQITFDDLK